MKTLTINVEDTKFEVLKDFLDSLGIDFYDNSDFNIQIPESQKKYIRELVKSSEDSDFISWKDFRSRINK
jgi:hypothetical protein